MLSIPARFHVSGDLHVLLFFQAEGPSGGRGTERSRQAVGWKAILAEEVRPERYRRVSPGEVQVNKARPGWMTAVGVLGIIFGCFGVMSASQTLLMPTMLEWQRKIFMAMQAQASRRPESDAVFRDFAAIFEQFMAPPPSWFTPWSVCLGLLSLATAGVYLFGAIWMLLMKPSAPRIFCGALIASVAVTILRAMGLIFAVGPFGLAIGLGGAFGMVIDLVLLIVVLAHRREWPDAVVQQPSEMN